MRNVLVIGSRDSGEKNNPEVLGAALQVAGGMSKVIYWEDLVLRIATGNVNIKANGHDLLASEPELVIALGWYKNGKEAIYRDLAYALALFLRARKIEFWNSEMALQRSTTKLSCMMQLALEDISVPSTTFSLDNSAISQYPLPFVAKAAAASRGVANYLVRTTQDLSQLTDDPQYYLLQPYLENDHDLRIICVGGKPVLALRRSRAKNAQTHLNNTSQGGEAQWLSLEALPETIAPLCGKICKVMGREMAGIDFIPDDQAPGGYSCLEVNAIPQLTSGFDAEKKLHAISQAIMTNERKTVV